MRDSQGKADLLANTLCSKFKLPEIADNGYAEISQEQVDWLHDRAKILTVDAACKVMQSLREDSATGPDLVPTRIIKRCAAALALPVYLLAMTILASGHWPDLYTIHWIACLYKKKSVFNPSNYRGVHMTAQFAKVLERFVGLIFLPQLSCEVSIGPNQFAYIKGRGARDALAYLVLSWLKAFQEKAPIALYMSDVSGAFDRVSASRLLQKLKARGMPEDLVALIGSWLRSRSAEVVVGGCHSTKLCLENMVYQGTVWGPSLWNAFYGDARQAVRACQFMEIIFADDLNAWRKYDAGTNHETMQTDMKLCQDELHKWGAANQVVFDPAKEGRFILHRKCPQGDDFELLGVRFDCKLIMSESVYSLAKDCRWKLKAILRTGRFNTGADLVNLYKAQVLSILEYRTVAIYHACNTSLEELQRMQDKLLEASGFASAVEAMEGVKLAPLRVRRDIAMLGLIHRAVLGKGPAQFREFFKPDELVRREGRGKHRLHLKLLPLHWSDFALPGSRPAAYVEQSAHGLIRVYNKLPVNIVERCSCVSSFQKSLQELVLRRAQAGHGDWELTLSPRVSSCHHPLDDIW